MKSSIASKVLLELDEDEAKWLREWMQNPIEVGCTYDEAEFDKSMCKKFWDALSYSDKVDNCLMKYPSGVRGLN